MTNAGLAGTATWIAELQVEPSGATSIDKVHLQTAPVELSPGLLPMPEGRVLVVCDEWVCPRAVGIPTAGGWALSAYQPMNSARLAPGVVPAGKEDDLGGDEATCFRGVVPLDNGVEVPVRVDLPAGQWSGAAALGDAEVTARWWSGEVWGPGAELVLLPGGATLTLLASTPELDPQDGCWTAPLRALGPPLRDPTDLAHWLQPHPSALPLAAGSLEVDGVSEPVRLLADGHGQLLLEVDGEAIAVHGARSAPTGTRWMYPLGERIFEVLLPTRDRLAPASAAQEIARALLEGEVALEVYDGDAEVASGLLRARAR